MSDYRDASAELGASAFHKATGVAAVQRRTEQEFCANFVDPATGKVFERCVTSRSCPLCGGSGGTIPFTKNGFEHILCNCGMVYVPRLLADEYLNLVYSGDQHEKATHDAFRAEPRRSFICEIYKAGLDLISQCGIESRECLDVGCSSGLFLEYAAERGFRAKGIEPSDYAVEYGTSRGLDIEKGYFTASAFSTRRFPLITLWDVLEHCSDPHAILSDAIQVLDDEGLLFLQVPNVSAIAPRVLRERCNMFNGFAHINLFGPETIRRLLEDAGFAVVKIRTVISEISVVNNYLDYHDPYFGPSTGRESVFSVIDPEFIDKHLLGYKLQVVAKKPGTA